MNNGDRHNALKETGKAATVWIHFDPSTSTEQCTSCSYFQSQCKGGRPKRTVLAAPKRKLSASFNVDNNADADISFCRSVPTEMTSTPV